MRVAVLGLGFMGSAAARRLSSRGFTVTVWNRSEEKARRLAGELGVKASRSPWDAVSDADAAVAFLSDDEALLNVVGLLRRADGLVFINMSTVTPKASEAAARHLEALGICYVESPVIGGPKAVESGSLIALVAGPERCVAPANPVIEALASRKVRVGEKYGQAAALKLAFNNMLLANLVSLAESLTLVEAYGVDIRLLKKVMDETFLSGVSERFFERVTSESVNPTFRARLAAKDAAYVREALTRAGALPLISGAVEQVFRLMDHFGAGDEDYTSVYRFLRKRKNGGEES